MVSYFRLPRTEYSRFIMSGVYQSKSGIKADHFLNSQVQEISKYQCVDLKKGKFDIFATMPDF